MKLQSCGVLETLGRKASNACFADATVGDFSDRGCRTYSLSTALSVVRVPEGVVQVLEVGNLLLSDGFRKGYGFDQV